MFSRACLTILARRRVQTRAQEHLRSLVPTSERCNVGAVSSGDAREQLTRHFWTTSAATPSSSIAHARDERVANVSTCGIRALDATRRAYSKKKKGKGSKKDAVVADDVSSNEDEDEDEDDVDDGAVEYDPKVWQR